MMIAKDSPKKRHEVTNRRHSLGNIISFFLSLSVISVMLQYAGRGSSSTNGSHLSISIKEAFDDMNVSFDFVRVTSTNSTSTTSTTSTTSSISDNHVSHQHNPQRFSNNIQLNVARGLNIINCWSGQTISAWIYAGEEPTKNAKLVSWNDMPRDKWVLNKEDATNKIHTNDTVFVSLVKIPEFVQHFLPYIQQEFVLITEGWHIIYPDSWLSNFSSDIVGHPQLLHWFTNNIQNYTGGYGDHPKVSPFPLGLKPNMPGARRSYRAPINPYRQAFLETLQAPPNKTTDIFVGYIRPTNTRRRGMPSGPQLSFETYIRSMASSTYVLSPDGDHPDCHRHYEALGMGAIPITELDPILYRHLNPGPVVFSNTNWNVTFLKASLPVHRPPTVNRNLVFEEYWMEYVERIVGRPLRWWDTVQQKACHLVDFAESSAASNSTNATTESS